MTAYLARRMMLAAFTVIIMSLLSFTVIQLPEGDYVDRYIEELEAQGDFLSMEEANALREYYGLDRPMLYQYWKWISRIVFQLDFGYSYRYYGKIRDLIADRLQFTIALSAFTTVLIWIFAFPVGIYSAVRQHTIGDYTFTFLGFAGLAVPDFLLGLVMMYFFFAYFGWSVGGLFSGRYQNADWSIGKFIDMLQHLIIPGVVLGTAGTAGLIRVMRNNLLDELNKPYVVTARSKGLPAWRLILKYPVRIALNPFISGIGGMMAGLLGSSVIVSVILSLPTLGPLMLDALMSQDMYLAGTIILMLGVLSVLGVLISDLLLIMVDPRIKLSGQSGAQSY